jgi:hypothetical protein
MRPSRPDVAQHEVARRIGAFERADEHAVGGRHHHRQRPSVTFASRSIRIGVPNDLPSSPENATRVFGVFSGAREPCDGRGRSVRRSPRYR